MPDTTLDFDDRATGILEGAKRAFAEKGFDGASMQDLARAAGMSAGNFYRYFPSKNAIIEAMIARDVADVRDDFERILASADPLDALMEALKRRLEVMGCADDPLWAEIDAAALRRPEIHTVVSTMECEIMLFLTTIFARITGLDEDAARQRFAAQAAFIILLFKGAAHRLVTTGRTLSDETRADLRSLFLKTMRQTIADVAAQAVAQKR
jgi:AcrR family transcriptional regulator